MKKMIIAAAIAALGASFGVAQAEPGNGCVLELVGGAPNTGASCEYTATGPATYIAATPNHWSIDVIRDGEQVNLESTDSLATPSTGDVATQAGDAVTVTIGPDDAEGFVEGWVGILIVVETE